VAKQVSNIFIRLGIENFEGIDKLKSAFRELDKSIGPSAESIARSRRAVLDYSQAAGNTEQAVKGTIDALKGLQAQTERGSPAWAALTNDVLSFQQASRKSEQEITVLRQGIINLTNGTAQSQQSLRAYITDLTRLRTEATISGTVFNQLGEDIAALSGRLNQVDIQLNKTSASFAQLNTRAIPSTGAGMRQRMDQYTAIADNARAAIDAIDLLANKQKNADVSRERAAQQQTLEAALANRAQLTYLEGSRQRRETARTSAQAFSTGEFAAGAGYLDVARLLQTLDRRFGELPRTTNGFNVALQDLNERLVNTTRNTSDYIAIERQLITVQREASAATQGLGAALVRDLRTGVGATESQTGAARNTKNLAEAVSQLRREMADLDTTTAEGFSTHSQNAALVNNLEEEIARLGRAYATAANSARLFADTQENAVLNQIINAATTGRTRTQQIARAEGMQELRQAIETGVQGTPLLLPAAGQTSAPGTGLARSGGARYITQEELKAAREAVQPINKKYTGYYPGGLEFTFGGTPEKRWSSSAFAPNEERPSFGPLPATAGYTVASEANARAVKNAGFSYRELAKDIRVVKNESTNSINSLEAQRSTWVKLQNAVEQSSNKYRLAAERIREIDAKLGRGSRSRISAGAAVQTAGAVLSGGIFGGAEGFLGGLGGAALGMAIPGLGPVGGAFAGSAAGAQAGMLRQQLGGTAEYAAQIGKLQIALRGVAGSQSNYTQALSAAEAATRELNIPQMEATQGITRLSAAVLGAGGTMGDATFAFRAIGESIKATGGNAEQVDGALLALTQVFSKGKVSAEELNQIAERLPGTFTLFAQAAGKSGPELQKALEQGEVGLNDLMKFLEMASSKYGSTAMRIAKSSEESGARLQIAYDKMRLDIGKALAPIGAELQSAFADFITNLAPSVVDSNGNIGASFAILIDPIQRIIDLFRELGQTKSDLQPLFDYIGYNIKALTTFFYANNLILEATIKRVVTSAATIAALVKGDFAAVQRLSVQAAKSEQAAFNSIPQTLDRIWNPAPKLADIRGTGRQVQGPGAAGSNFPNPVADGSGSGTRRGDAARVANDAQRLNESIAQQEIRLADKVFDHKQDLARRRYELEKELLDLETQNRLERMGSVEREAASIFEQQRQRDRQYAEKLAQANDEVAKAAQAIASAQRMAAVTGGAGGGRAGLPAGMTGYITGDPSSPYYKADHGGANYHEHAAFADRATAEAAYKILTNAGIRVTEFLGRGQVGRHTPGSAHYSGLAFDVPASQVPVGQEPALTARVKRLLGIGGTGGGALQRRATADQGDVGAAKLDYAQAVERRRLLEEKQAAFAAASREAAAIALTKAFSEQNQELEKSLKNESARAELQKRGYSESYIKLQLELNDALERRNALASQVPFDQPGALAEINSAYEKRIELLQKTYDLEQNLANSVGFREGAQRYVESIGTLREATAGLAQQGFKGIEDSIVSLATTGTANFAQFATSLLNDMARIIIQQFVVKQLAQAIGSLFGMPSAGGGGLGNYGVELGLGFNQLPSFPMGSALPSFAGFAGMAKGGVLGANGIVPYAKGGVVTRPMLFPFANGGAIGTGLMGEAGPEAIMPLQRGPNGKLGVMSTGGGATTVVVNVDATGGSSVQGNEDKANQLGKVISAAVQSELVKQKRPGGLLA
jgi:lambda family phage tail tape measure protein